MSMAKFRPLLLGLTLVIAAPALGGLAPAYAAADQCAPGVASDFNGDGRSDAVVADPYATVAGLAEAGRVNVLYGDADGLVGEGARGIINQGSGSVGGIAETGDRFGSSIAVADIDCDNYTDLVVGSPYEDINGASDSGYAQIIWGRPGGLGAGTASRNLTQTDFGLSITAGDQFGYAVDALEDVGQGGTPAPDAFAIAIGVPGFNVGGKNDAGLVAVSNAVDGGSEEVSVTQDSDGIPGTAEAGDRFGAAVSFNYLTGGADTADLVVGVPNEDVGSASDAGTITVVTDVYDATFLSGVGIDQNSAGVPGTAESGDFFGRSLDTVRVGGTTRLAVGAPGEDIGSAANAGTVQLFSSNATSITPGTGLTQDTAGVSDSAQSGDVFGDKVAWAAPGLADSTTRLAVSATKEDGAATDTGMVQVFPMTSLGSETTYTQNSAGIPGAAAAGDKFGSSLAVVEGASERVLLVGVPDDTANATGMVNVIPFSGGTPRFWKPGTSGVPATGASRFGDALASVTG
jgi:hypothetical protein